MATEKRLRYKGYFLMDSGAKVNFDISEEDGGEKFSESLYGNMDFPFNDDDIVWLGENSNLKLRADKIIGWDINEYEE